MNGSSYGMYFFGILITVLHKTVLHHFDGLVQDYTNSIVNTLELQQFCT